MRKWTQRKITEWAVETFGRPSDVLDIVDRAADEFVELVNAADGALGIDTVGIDEASIAKVREEIADVVIVLSQVMEHLDGDLDIEVFKKMEKNSKRNWIKTGDGIGRHQ